MISKLRRLWARIRQPRVPKDWGCPECGECRQDYLVWNFNGTLLTCASCGLVYMIKEG